MCPSYQSEWGRPNGGRKLEPIMSQNFSRSAIGSFALLLVLPGAILYALVGTLSLDVWMTIVIVISPIAAVLLAHLSLKQIRTSTDRMNGMRLAEMSLLFGYAE